MEMGRLMGAVTRDSTKRPQQTADWAPRTRLDGGLTALL